MTTIRRPLVLLAFLVIAIAACSSAAAPSTAPTATPPAATPPPASSAPGGGTQPGEPGSGAPVAPDAPTDPGDTPLDPGGGRLVVPRPGQLDVRPIAAETLTAQVEGRKVIVTIAYTSGVEPCYILDSIVVKTGANSFEITLNEGHGPEDVACIEIAESKRAIVDLGELAPGTYTITDGQGGAAPITVTVS